MSDIKERLDKVRALIQEPEFLEGKGLSNEVNIRIFCYEPENEMVVRHFVNQLETDQSLDCHLIVCNLYKTFLSICDDMDITDAIPDMEEADGSAYLLEQLNSCLLYTSGQSRSGITESIKCFIFCCRKRYGRARRSFKRSTWRRIQKRVLACSEMCIRDS